MKLILPAPSTQRDTLRAFLFYEKDRGLPSIVGRFDFQGVTRRQAFEATIGELPAKFAGSPDPDGFKPRGAFIKTLSTDDFQQRIREIIMSAFPEKQRIISIHIPKCAGSDLNETMRRQYPLLDSHLCLPAITEKPDFFEKLRLFMTAMQFTDAIALSGHTTLKWYLDRALVRPQDQIFATIRNPRDRVYSHLSYVLSTIMTFRGTYRHDTTGWLEAIGLKDIEPDPSPAYLTDLGRRMLRNRNVTPPNVLCDFLGSGTAASAIEQMAKSDIEITDTPRYSAWRAAKFGYDPTKRVNESQPLFTPDHADESDRKYVEELVSEDLILYEKIQNKMSTQNGLSIKGQVFA